jgi:uncharacterized protein
MFTAKQYGPWAVIAGGSEGLAASFARNLANVGIHLVLIARRREPLDRLADEIRTQYSVDVRTLSLDLARPDVLEQIRAVSDDLQVGLLIFNAGNTGNIMGGFLERSLEDVLGAARVTAIAQTTLAHHFGSRMAARGRGGLILVGSLSGNAGTPKMATYCASKAFSQIFAEALWGEFKPLGIDVLSLVLGLTDTPARKRSGVPLADIPGMPVLNPDDVAEQALAHLADGGPVYVTPPYEPMFQYLCSTPRRQLGERMSGAGRSSQQKT